MAVKLARPPKDLNSFLGRKWLEDITTVDKGATANVADLTLLDRANHTGTQLSSTISDFNTAVTTNSSVTANTAKVTNQTHTGAVTGSTALTITAKAVTLSKMDDVATSTVFYRKTAGTGTPEINTLATLKTDLGLTGTNSGDQDLSGYEISEGIIIADTTVANTITETTIFTDAITSNILYKGLKVHARVSGHYSTANGADTFTFRLKIGGTTILSVVSTAANVTNAFWKGEFFFTVRSSGASGTVIASFQGVFNDNVKNAANTAVSTVDTTVSEDITATVEWSNALAGNTLTITQGHVDTFGALQA